MPILVGTDGGTTITFNDSSTQSTAFTGAIGQGQTWQNLTSSRAWGTTYTNSTGKPIMFTCSGYASGVAGDKTLAMYINGNNVLLNGSFGTTGTPYQSGTLIVPAGATYSANSVGGNYITLSLWWELR